MSEISPWLRSQKKYELIHLAEAAGLRAYQSLKKAQLEAALDAYLRENEDELSRHPMFELFYARPTGPERSPIKRESVSPSYDDEPRATRRRTRRSTRHVVDVVVQQDAPYISEESEQLAAPETPSRSNAIAQVLPLPPSPAVVADVIDTSTAEIRAKVDSIWEDAGLRGKAEELREYLSSIVSIETAVLAVEAFGLRSKVLPLRYAFSIPIIAGLRSTETPVYLPDLFLLLTASFWAPVTLWTCTSLFIPLLFAYFFNLTLRPIQRHPSKADSHARTASRVDPLMFNVAKALVTYMVYSQRAKLGGFFADHTIDAVRGAVPGGLHGLFIGAAIGAITSIYDAILSN